jgi:dolichol-phosphate mannosyltransferase
MKTSEKTATRVSVVVPAFNEAANVAPLSDRLAQVLRPLGDYEIWFIDDGSTDGTLEALRRLRQVNPRIGYVSFSRNFGHQSALRAGLDAATGDCVITLDADGQHPPETIPDMMRLWKDGADIVTAVRSDYSSNGPLKRLTSRFFYRLMNSLADVRLETGAADFRLLDRCAVDAIRAMPESNMFIRGMIGWIGFRHEKLPYRENARMAGETKYSLGRMISLAIQGITSFSIRPLRLATLLGSGLALLSMAYGVYALWAHLAAGRTVPGWTSIIASVLFCSGVQMLLLGILGEYIGRLYIESKRRPPYVVREKSCE